MRFFRENQSIAFQYQMKNEDEIVIDINIKLKTAETFFFYLKCKQNTTERDQCLLTKSDKVLCLPSSAISALPG